MHNYEEHGGKKIKQHWLLTISRSSHFDGGEMILFEKPPSFDVFAEPSKYETVPLRLDDITETNPLQYRLFNCIKFCAQHVFHINIFTFYD